MSIEKGDRINYLTVIDKKGKNCICRCDCGNTKTIRSIDILRGNVKSCGNDLCPYHHKLLGRTHGMSRERLYGIWNGMKQRCYNPKSIHYSIYGGRGITICDEWKNNYLAFKEWALENGYKDNLTIDRINNNEGYSPNNCRWATVIEQNNNQAPNYTYKKLKRNERKHKLIWTINGCTKSAVEWCEEYKVSMPFVLYRINKKGMTPFDALTIPKHSTISQSTKL